MNILDQTPSVIKKMESCVSEWVKQHMQSELVLVKQLAPIVLETFGTLESWKLKGRECTKTCVLPIFVKTKVWLNLWGVRREATNLTLKNFHEGKRNRTRKGKKLGCS